MKAVRILTALLICILLLCAAAQAEQAWVKERISVGGSLYKGMPKAYQDKVYWTQESGPRSESGDIYVWDRAGGERPAIATSANEMVWAVYEDKLAITEYTNGQHDLFLYDPVNGKTAISTAPGDQWEADLYGDLLVWEDHRGPVPQVYKWDPINGEQIISPSPMIQDRPHVFGDTIVWNQNDGAGHNDSYMWNAREGTRKISTYIYSMGFPDIYDDTIIMGLPYEPGMLDPYGIWEYKIGQGLIGPLVPYIVPYDIHIWGDTIAMGPFGSYGSIVAWTPGTGLTKLYDSWGLCPDVYDKTVAWGGADNSIWIAQLVPEPTGPLAFGSLLSLTGLLWVRRGRFLSSQDGERR